MGGRLERRGDASQPVGKDVPAPFSTVEEAFKTRLMTILDPPVSEVTPMLQRMSERFRSGEIRIIENDQEVPTICSFSLDDNDSPFHPSFHPSIYIDPDTFVKQDQLGERSAQAAMVRELAVADAYFRDAFGESIQNIYRHAMFNTEVKWLAPRGKSPVVYDPRVNGPGQKDDLVHRVLQLNNAETNVSYTIWEKAIMKLLPDELDAGIRNSLLQPKTFLAIRQWGMRNPYKLKYVDVQQRLREIQMWYRKHYGSTAGASIHTARGEVCAEHLAMHWIKKLEQGDQVDQTTQVGSDEPDSSFGLHSPDEAGV
jgi:hypothetical protein